MKESRISKLVSYNDKVIRELFDIKILVNATITCCQKLEFNGEFYDIPDNCIKHISNERNSYLSLLSIISDKLLQINNFCLCLERELFSLQENPDDRSR